MPYKMPPLLALRAFEVAARHLSFTAAAAELNLTQGAISRQIRVLEDYLGKKLFDRYTRRVELTDLGREYYLTVHQVVESIDRATHRIMHGGGRGLLNLGVLPSLGASWLMPRLTLFSERYPHIQVRLISAIEPANLQSGNIDLAIRVGRIPGETLPASRPRIDLEMVTRWSGVKAHRLFPDVLQPVLSRKLLDEGGGIAVPGDLLRYPLIHTASRRGAWADWLATKGLAAHDAEDALEYGHFFMSLQAARQHKGVAIIPTALLQTCPALGSELVCPLESDIESAGAYYLLAMESRIEAPPLRQLWNWLISEGAELSQAMAKMALAERALPALMSL